MQKSHRSEFRGENPLDYCNRKRSFLLAHTLILHKVVRFTKEALPVERITSIGGPPKGSAARSWMAEAGANQAGQGGSQTEFCLLDTCSQHFAQA